MALPPGPGGLPFIGDLKMFSDDTVGYGARMYERFGSLYTLNFGLQKLVMMTSPEYNHYVLAEHAGNFLSGPMADLSGGPMWGHGVLFSDGEVHKQARRMMQPAFHKKRIESYLAAMVEETQRFIAPWAGEIDLSTLLHELTLNIVARVFFALDIAKEVHDLSQAWAAVLNHNTDPLGMILARLPFSGRRQGMKVIDQLIERIISERRANPEDKNDVLTMLLEAKDEDGYTFSDKEIRDQLVVLFLAGHETSANGLAFVFYLLAQHPEWAGRVLTELQSVLGGQTPTFQDLDQLTTLDMVIKESLRLLPPVPGFTRCVANDFEIDGYRIPAGAWIYYSTFGVHRIPALYPEPETFKPERFAPNAERKYSPYEYLPFGAGARLCLGMPMAQMEMKIILAMVLQKYRLDLVADQNIHLVVRGSLTTRHGIRMRINPQDGRVECSAARVYGNIPCAVGK